MGLADFAAAGLPPTDSTCVDHLSLHRMERVYQRQGLFLHRSTLCDWMAACANLLRPRYDRMVRVVMQSRSLHTDDTTVKMQELLTPFLSTACLWVYLGDAAHLVFITMSIALHSLFVGSGSGVATANLGRKYLVAAVGRKRREGVPSATRPIRFSEIEEHRTLLDYAFQAAFKVRRSSDAVRG